MATTHEAMFWQPLEDGKVQCSLCAHRCRIAQGKFGICRVRQNIEGSLKTFTYGALIAMNVDPIEKKPLFHFLPGTQSLSVATPGCNFQCPFCQNWQISQPSQIDRDVPAERQTPRGLVEAAVRHGCASISYTYTEPTIFFEFAYDTARLAQERGLGNCFVSNGYMTAEAVEAMAPYLDAINVDLKAFREETYRNTMRARLQPVLECLEALVAAGVWVEVTTLVVPDMNDSTEELRDIAAFIAERLGPHVPWHVSRFHGNYKMTSTPSTPLEALQRACRLGRDAGLQHVYCGNVQGEVDERTHCPACDAVVVDRSGYLVRGITLRDGACPQCGQKIEGRWSLSAQNR